MSYKGRESRLRLQDGSGGRGLAWSSSSKSVDQLLPGSHCAATHLSQAVGQSASACSSTSTCQSSEEGLRRVVNHFPRVNRMPRLATAAKLSAISASPRLCGRGLNTDAPALPRSRHPRFHRRPRPHRQDRGRRLRRRSCTARPDFGFSQEFAEYRAYSQGDDLRHVDWNVFARTDRCFLKRYRGETNTQLLILLDTSASMGYGSHAGPQAGLRALRGRLALLHGQRASATPPA